MPVTIELEPGTYWWCSCGKSNDLPFCDGSHVRTEHLPLKFAITERKKITLCNCQRTKNAPFCDGSHC